MPPEEPSLVRSKHPSVKNPQLQRPASTHSSSTSDNYYSLSDPESDDKSNLAAFHFFPELPQDQDQPPPPVSSRLRPGSQLASSSVKSLAGLPPSQPSAKLPGTVAFDESTIMQKQRAGPSAANPAEKRRSADSYSPATTPGVDDTPYIRFAIDQLTRDEEVRGSRRYPGALEDVREEEPSEDSYPVERIVPDEGLGYVSQHSSPQQNRHSRQSQYFQDPQQQYRHSQQSQYSQDPRQYRYSQQPQYIPADPQHPRDSQQFQYAQDPQQQTPQVSRPASTLAPSMPSLSRESTYRLGQMEDSAVSRDIFTPHYPPPDSLLQGPLDFIPAILRPLPLLSFLLACCLMLAGLLFSGLWSRNHNGLRKYHEFGGPYYFVFQYLPTLLGMFVLLWLFQIETALRRIVPFMALASGSGRSRDHAIFLDLVPKSFLLPHLQYFTHGFPLMGLCSLIFWLFLFTIPLLSSCFNVRYHGTVARGEWRWVAVEIIVWTTSGLYGLLIVAILLLLASIHRKSTGLKWDPRSLADIICLIERSNVVNDYAGSETFISKKEFRKRMSGRSDRLGYWHTSKRPTDIFYGLGQPGENTRRFSLEQGRIKEKGAERHTLEIEPQRPAMRRYTTDFSIRMDIRSSRIRLRYLPWYLRDSAVVAWVVICVFLVLAFLIVSFLNNAIRDGFRPGVSAATRLNGFSASNFLYSFVPSLIGLILFLCWQSMDLTFRALQPYAAMSAREGATAEQSLLVDYSARLPISVSVIAAANGHYRVATLSFMTLVNMSLPVIAGGVFWTQFYARTRSIRVAAHLPGFYALCFFLVLYTLATIMFLPGRRRMALPHAPWSLAETISFLYQSPILMDRAFARPPTKAELVTRLMGASWTDQSTFSRSLTNLVNPSRRTLRDVGGSLDKGKDADHHETRDSIPDAGSIRYGFGVHVGRDGQEHLGVDRLKRRIGREMVIHEAQRRSWISRV